MTHLIDPALRQQPQEPIASFLYSTPGGFEDREEDTTYPELCGQLIRATSVVKVFEHNSLVHTSEECGNDPSCPKCQRGRLYVRLVLNVDGRRYQLDLPPSARRGFIALAEEIGNDPAPIVRLTSTRKESSRGMEWAHIACSLVRKEAA
jgi:hypothetical protein